jgi:hypothetical protein
MSVYTGKRKETVAKIEWSYVSDCEWMFWLMCYFLTQASNSAAKRFNIYLRSSNQKKQIAVFFTGIEIIEFYSFFHVHYRMIWKLIRHLHTTGEREIVMIHIPVTHSYKCVCMQFGRCSVLIAVQCVKNDRSMKVHWLFSVISESLITFLGLAMNNMTYLVRLT